MQIVHFHQSNSGRTVYAAQNRGVVTWWQLCNDRRLSAVRWGVTAGPDVAHLAVADNPADDRGVVTRWQVCDDCRFPSVSGCVAAVPDVVDLAMSDNSTDNRSHPVVIRGYQRSRAIVQLQGGIRQCIRNAILSELRTYRS